MNPSSLRIMLAMLVAASMSSCDDRSSPPAAINTTETAGVAANGANAPKSSALLELLKRNFQRAMNGVYVPQKEDIMPAGGNSAGIDCSPARLLGKAQYLQIKLPPRSAHRPAVLAAIVPDGTLRIIYISYHPDTDVESIITPSRTIDWETVKTKRDFQVEVDKFDALVPDADAPTRLFQKAGMYQLALLDGFPYSIPTHNERPFNVLAGCVIKWQP